MTSTINKTIIFSSKNNPVIMTSTINKTIIFSGAQWDLAVIVLKKELADPTLTEVRCINDGLMVHDLYARVLCKITEFEQIFKVVNNTPLSANKGFDIIIIRKKDLDLVQGNLEISQKKLKEAKEKIDKTQKQLSEAQTEFNTAQALVTKFQNELSDKKRIDPEITYNGIVYIPK